MDTRARPAASAVAEPTGADAVPGETPPGMVLHNSMSRKKEPFVPRRDDGKVSMYVCGVTVYDYSHIGHARVYVAFDVLYRQLMRQGYRVGSIGKQSS